ncbi:MAG: VCBS repeat-containing protein [Lunatimonas sp.]|uniref:VCBS repeat-containing protein n=1 Tax=Lunatimonas sp. TaxID=2060141 RepID=UPI00263AB6D4|nr:VCBS repeat-containing protein [Lunatimonas sp.]MCC5939746.1 VCBS repeat-containing protein [Lunatimonas sp.]
MTLLNCRNPLLLFALVLVASCDSPKEVDKKEEPASPPLFTLLPAESTGISFENTLTEGLNTNILMYEYFYNGGGVAVGDLNGDGLDDIYFTGNMVPNKLYLNKGSMQFEDVTLKANVAGRPGPWATGVTMADVNGDGLLDIYVCYSGSLPPDKRRNQLFINQGPDEDGIPIFSEEAEHFGLDSEATSTQAVFFDMDNDGDLDLFLLNHNPKSLPILDESNTAEILKHPDLAGPQLFRNDNGKFTDVTEKAGIFNSALSYGLGAGVSDINGNGYLDIYVSNDYTVPDYLYINNGDGTFTDLIGESMGHISNFSMGSDIADINNDGLVDIFTLDMLPEDNRRQKLLMAPDNYEKFEFNLRVGFHHQYMRNMLHLNHGNGTFSEIGQLAGISNTDWSWAALFADFDNDGWKDLYVTNGYHRDYTNQDFLKYMADYIKKYQGLKRENVLELVYSMPSSNVINYMFQNTGGIRFENQTSSWGLDQVANSNGAAYADLDNDGDLDLIVNNVSLPAFIYRNDSEKRTANHYLKFKLEGENKNSHGLGAKVTVYHKGTKQFLEQMPTRGYQSSVSPVLHVGLGSIDMVDSLHIYWPSGKSQSFTEIPANQTLVLVEAEAKKTALARNVPEPVFKPSKAPFQNVQPKHTLNDFKRQPLLINPLSFVGPVMAKADINGDGLEDVFVGADAGSAAKIYLQTSGGNFREGNSSVFDEDTAQTDSHALFLDVNGDGFIDLYVGSGGYGNFLPKDPKLQDRIYLNDGKGNFEKASGLLPEMFTSTGTVAATDLTGNGLPDLFVGSRVIPGRYPETPDSYLLINDGQGNYSIQTAQWAPDLQKAGLVTDAAWADLNGDGLDELIVVGEWMPIRIFKKSEDTMVEVGKEFLDEAHEGWWNTLWVGDINGDGKPDLLVGNQGLNSQVQASTEEPAELHYKDFDNNGAVDPILSFYIQGKSYPYLTRDELLDQLSMMRTRFTNYADYADATLTDIFSKEELKGAGYEKATQLKTSLFLSQPDGKLAIQPLPIEAQFAPVFSILVDDFDRDGHQDILLGGNIERARLRFGKYDANFGTLLKGNGKGEFSYVPQLKSGLQLIGDVRSMLLLNDLLLIAINQKGITAYEITQQANE